MALVVVLGTVSPAHAAAPEAFDDTMTVTVDSPASVFLPAEDPEFDDLTYTIVSPPSHGTLDDCSGGFCTYTPATGYVGPDSFTWKANDGTADSNVATMSITVAANQPPVAADDSMSVVADSPTLLFLPADDPEFDALTFTIVSPPSHGSLDDCSDGVCTYTPSTGYIGPDSFTWKANDGTADSNVATMSIDVAPAPVTDLRVGAVGETSAVLTWTNPAVVDSIVVRYSAESQPMTPGEGTGVPVVGTPETATLTGLAPGTQYFASVFAVRGGQPSEAATAAVHTSFACTADLAAALDGGSLVVGQDWVLCAGESAHNPASTVSNVLPMTGTSQALMTSGDATIATPPDDGGGEGASTPIEARGANDVSIYRIDVNVPDGHSCLRFDYVFASEEYPEFVGSAFNDGFLAQVDQNAWTVNADSTISVTGNFAQLSDGSVISVNGPVFADASRVVTPPTNGTGFDGMSQALTASTPITPGPHSIYLSIFDAGDHVLDSAVFLDNLRTGTATTTCVAGSNQAPDAVDDSASTAEDTQKGVTVTVNDTDPDGDPLQVVGNGQGAHGSVSCSAGTCTYTPEANFHGTDTFTYTVGDGAGGTDVATVTVTVTPVNDAPVAVDDSATTSESTATMVGVLTNDDDVDGDSLTVSGHGTATNGTVSCSTTSCTYTPDAGFSGTDSFTYTISDGHGGTDTATVTVTVEAAGANTPPVAVDDSATTSEDTAKVVAVLGNDSDADGDTLSVTGNTDPAHGTVTCSTTSCTYTPDADYTGPDSFSYTVSDGHGGTDTATVTITVTPVNDAPVAVDDSATTSEDTATVVGVLTNDSDVDGDTLSVTGNTDPAHGTVTCSTTSCTYTPDADHTGPDSFSYTVSDGHGGTDTATVTITVTPVNDAPVAVDDSATTSEDTAKVVGVLTNDSDVDGDTLSVTGNTDPAHGTVSCSTTTCTYTPEAGFSGTDTFTYTVGDGHGGTDTATVTITVTPAARPDVAVTKTPLHPSVPVGQTTGWTIEVRNVGTAPTGTVTLTDQLPDAFLPKAEDSTACSISTTALLTCAWSMIPAGEARTVHVSGAFVDVGTVQNTATAGAADDPVAANDSDTASTTVTGKDCTIVGTFGDDVLLGSNAADVICGLEGNDRINGKRGNDTLYGNAGNDRLMGLGGDDLVDGGPGADTTLYSALRQAVRIDLGDHRATGQGRDTLVSVEHATGSVLSDVIRGNGLANVLAGLGGNDLIVGASGRDTLLGGGGADVLKGGGGRDLLNGGKGGDTCRSGGGGATQRSC